MGLDTVGKRLILSFKVKINVTHYIYTLYRENLVVLDLKGLQDLQDHKDRQANLVLLDHQVPREYQVHLAILELQEKLEKKDHQDHLDLKEKPAPLGHKDPKELPVNLDYLGLRLVKIIINCYYCLFINLRF